MNNIKNYWTLPRHTSDWGNIDELVSLVKSKKYHPLNPKNKRKMWMDLHSQKKASARNKKFKADSISHRFESLEFFKFAKLEKKTLDLLKSPLLQLAKPAVNHAISFCPLEITSAFEASLIASKSLLKIK